jgi:phosphate uptake regulator
MKRSVIQIADSTQLVSLPRKWADKHNIKKGDELEVVEEKDRLCIFANEKTELKKRELDISNLTSILPRVLHGLYKAGYDEVKLHYKNPEAIDIIQQKLHDEIIGFEIIEQKQDYCIIRSFSEALESEFDVVLKQIFVLLESMTEGCVEALTKKNFSMIKSLQRLEASNNKYTGHCRRIINKGHYRRPHSELMYALVRELEMIADELKYMCDSLIHKEDSLNNLGDKAVGLFIKLAKFYQDCHNLYYRYDIEKATELFELRKKLLAEAKSIQEKSVPRSSDIVVIHHIIVIVQKIINVADLKFQMEI